MSRLIKASHYFTMDEIKLIEAVRQEQWTQSNEEHTLSEEEQHEIADAHSLKDQILRDAEAFAEEQLRSAIEQSAAAQQQAQHEIEAWWQEQRQKDVEVAAEASQHGYKQGYEEGIQAAEQAVREQFADMLQEAAAVLSLAYENKQRIIQEAEPFLIELSSSIAEKIIQKQLTLESSWITELAKSVLARRRERGVITLCVSPKYYPVFQDAREELMLMVDSQAELQILPDGSVQDHGCVVRSAFGSIDARIDTQLNEVKAALQQIALSEEGASFDE